MTNSEVLSKAINKAIENGWEAPASKFHVSTWLGDRGSNMLDNPTVRLAVWFDVVNGQFVGEQYHATDLIYNHEFAKALWNEDTKFVEQWNSGAKSHSNVPLIDIEKYQPEWQYHLQQLVISPDPIQYLAEHI